MGNNTSFPHLTAPITINSRLTLRNRMVKAPQSSWFFEKDGSAGDRATDFYEALAAGGVGLLIVSAITWRPDHPYGPYGALSDDRFIPGMKRLVDRVHSHDCPVMCQLHHGGPSAAAGHGGGLPVGASPMDVADIPSPGKAVHGLTREEIEEDKKLYFDAAERVVACGFDGIEVHCAHGYYLESFLSRVWNHRDDEYGPQNMENRTRLIVEIITELRRRFGPDYPIGLRMNGHEWGARGGLTVEEAVEAARIFEKAGVNYISVSGYGYGPLPFRYLPDYWPYPEPEEHMKPYMDDYRGLGLLIPGAAAVKKAVSIPVIAVGRMDENKGETVLAEGKADLVAFGRYLWADPEFPNKVMDGRIDDIVRCTRCGTCEDPPAGRPRRCRVNPAMGREAELRIVPTDKPKKVLVIGGGPAGMETARVAAMRGHKVILCEKSRTLGGKLPLASMIKGSDVEDIRSIVPYYTGQLAKLPVDIRLNTAVDADYVRRESPDAVVIATGGLYTLPGLPGVNGRNVSGVNSLSRQVKLPIVVFGPDLLHKLTRIFLPIGRRVVIIGGRIEGVQGAIFLNKRGREVCVLEDGAELGKGIPPRYMDRVRPWFDKRGITARTEVTFKEITSRGVVYLDKDGKEHLAEGDSVMVLTSQVPDFSLKNSIEGFVPEVHMAGSVNGAEVGSLIINAIENGRRIGCSL